MDPQIKSDLLALPRLSQKVLNNLNITMRALAKANLNTAEFTEALKNSQEANLEAAALLKKQKAVIRAIRE